MLVWEPRPKPGDLGRSLLGLTSNKSEMQVVVSGQLQIFKTESNIRVPEKCLLDDVKRLISSFTWTGLKTWFTVAAFVIFSAVFIVGHQFSRGSTLDRKS